MSFIKRLFDIVFSLCALILFLPFGLGIALLIKISSRGPIFYSSLRVGKKGKPLYCWKFRTMCVDAEKKLIPLLMSNPALKKEWEQFYKLKEDPRISLVGKFLRKTSLDEFPQFWNVLRGDLSVVGPRPVTEKEVKEYFGKRADKILSVRPGLTGIWQVSGRSLLSFPERVLLEESYVDRQSFMLDLHIICKTIPKIFFGRGAF